MARLAADPGERSLPHRGIGRFPLDTQVVQPGAEWELDDVEAWWCAADLDSPTLVGHGADELVTPASVMKVQVALAAASLIESGDLDGESRCELPAGSRTPGPVGMSLMRDSVKMSVRDLLIPMLTISDNVATDALIGCLGLSSINAATRRLELGRTLIVDDLRTMLDTMAAEVGFADYVTLSGHDPAADGPPSADEVRRRVAASSALDPTRGSRTTPAEMVYLLRAIWADRAGPAPACALVRALMGQQLTRHRIAAGFDSQHVVAAKSGGLMGIVRNEVGVVTDPEGRCFVIAIFTCRDGRSSSEPAAIDAAIGHLAHDLTQHLAHSD